MIGTITSHPNRPSSSAGGRNGKCGAVCFVGADKRRGPRGHTSIDAESYPRLFETPVSTRPNDVGRCRRGHGPCQFLQTKKHSAATRRPGVSIFDQGVIVHPDKPPEAVGILQLLSVKRIVALRCGNDVPQGTIQSGTASPAKLGGQVKGHHGCVRAD